jgi:uncharacterized membrane protein YhaH (DUF805 family)
MKWFSKVLRQYTDFSGRVGARRLRDTGRSGWWQLLAFIPVIGAIVLIVFYATAGERTANSYGPDPKALPADYLIR